MNASAIGSPFRFRGAGQKASAGNSIYVSGIRADAGGMERRLRRHPLDHERPMSLSPPHHRGFRDSPPHIAQRDRPRQAQIIIGSSAWSRAPI
jgi:hypothetical protein